MPSMRFTTVAIDELNRQGLVPDSGHPLPLVLVVDDEEVIADTLVLILQAQGFAAIGAYGGTSALEIATVVPPNLLLTDVIMPDMNGVQLAMEICEQTPDCRVVLLSGQTATTDLLANCPDIVKAFTLPAKPIQPLELVSELSQLLAPNGPRVPVA